jgi:Sulfotransferase domain
MTNQKARLPNLFLVGAMKSATTSLHNYLDLHPEIFMTKDPWKEPGYFVKEINLGKGIDWYLDLFKEAKNEKFLGESSVGYTRSPNYPGVPERIHNSCPDAKIIYIMRDPIERAMSQYWWEVQYSAEGRRMPSAILNNDWIMSASNYAMQLRPYIQLFGADNIYTLTTEELQSAPNETLRKIFTWLGVDAEYELADQLKTYNRSANEVNQIIGSGVFSHLKGTKFWQTLKTILPISLRRRLKRLLARPVVKNEDDREETVALLRPIMQGQVQELSALLGKQFPEWKTVNGKQSD